MKMAGMRMVGMKKTVTLILVFVLLACVAPKLDTAEARPVRMEELRPLNEPRVRILPGEIRASEQVDMSFRVGGTLQEIVVVRGSQVRAGDLIAVLDTRDIENNLTMAQSELQSAQAQLSAMRGGRPEDIAALTAQVNAARARYNEATVNLERNQQMLAAGGVSQSQVDSIRTALQVERSALNVAQQNLASARAGARPEEINMQEAVIQGATARVRAAQDALNDAELRAPFDGTVADIFVDNFQPVQMNQTVATLQGFAALEVVVAIPGSMALGMSSDRVRTIRDVNRVDEISHEHTAYARFPSMPDRLFRLLFREAATVGNVQTQTFDATFMMEIPDDLLILPGMGIDVMLSLNSGNAEEDGFAVPFSALAAGEGGRQYVWRVEENGETMTVHRVGVTVTGYVGDRSIIRGDLTAGNRIVTAGLSYLHDGFVVTPFIFPAGRSVSAIN